MNIIHDFINRNHIMSSMAALQKCANAHNLGFAIDADNVVVGVCVRSHLIHVDKTHD